jgi:hypothetical protein
LDHLKIIEELPYAVFLAVDVETPQVRRRSMRFRPEYQLEMAITFDPTVG